MVLLWIKQKQTKQQQQNPEEQDASDGGKAFTEQKKAGKKKIQQEGLKINLKNSERRTKWKRDGKWKKYSQHLSESSRMRKQIIKETT